ncbi:fucolectin-like isoform X1 [Branchiostoma floridae x Branchiostoma belcheri]
MAGDLTLFALLLLLGHSAEANMCAGIRSTNLAKNRPATQSSTAHRGVASRAVDGSRHPLWKAGSCTHTASQTNPWWRVDLGSSQCVDSLVVVNRLDCCSERLDGFTVHVGDNPDVLKNPTCGGPQSVSRQRGNVMSIGCGGRTGRYVGISLTGSSRVLTLCEVEVFGGAQGKRMLSLEDKLESLREDLEKAVEMEALEDEDLEKEALEKKALEEEGLGEEALEEEALKEEVLEKIALVKEALEDAIEMEK